MVVKHEPLLSVLRLPEPGVVAARDVQQGVGEGQILQKVEGLTANLLGLDGWLAARGSSFVALLAFAALFGFGGSFISLLISKWIAKRSMGVRVIEQPVHPATPMDLLRLQRGRTERVDVTTQGVARAVA
jgi:Zn-dependent protease with chaperone function